MQFVDTPYQVEFAQSVCGLLQRLVSRYGLNAMRGLPLGPDRDGVTIW